MNYTFEKIGVMQTPFTDKFGIPRQPGLVASAKGVLKLRPDARLTAALRELETFTHVWIIFVFHRHGGGPWRAAIRPPRLGGSKVVGVLASRSPHRPNPVGMSAVRLDRIDVNAKGGAEVHVSGVDLLDGTPVLDIKPYLPYADSIPEASAGWASAPIPRVPITLAEGVEIPEDVRDWVLETLTLDPRPAFQKRKLPANDPANDGKLFGMTLGAVRVEYEIRDGGFQILSVTAP